MSKNNITIKNLLVAILFLILGIILLTTDSSIISIASQVIGTLLTIIGFIKFIRYVYMKGKMSSYTNTELMTSLFIMCFGLLLIFYSDALSFTIRFGIGFWTIFSGINRIIFSIGIKTLDKKGFLTYLLSSLFIIAIGILLISGFVNKIIGVFIIIYSVIEIIDYIYYKVFEKKYDNIKYEEKDKSSVKKIKNKKVMDAIIDENK